MLISGFFGIEFKFKGLYKLFVQCAFYGFLFYLLHLYFDKAKLGWSVIDNSLFVLSTPPGWWFIRVSVCMYLLSPILNKAIENINQLQFKILLIILAVLIYILVFCDSLLLIRTDTTSPILFSCISLEDTSSYSVLTIGLVH